MTSNCVAFSSKGLQEARVPLTWQAHPAKAGHGSAPTSALTVELAHCIMDVVCDKFCCNGSILEDNTEVVIGTCAQKSVSGS